MTSVINIEGQEQKTVDILQNLSLQGHEENEKKTEGSEMGFMDHGGMVCAICLDKIILQETALVKGCEHAYCVTCILRWASYNQKPTCPQCKHPFEYLNVHRSLDGSIQDSMFQESVCLLLRARWFEPLELEPLELEEDWREVYDDLEDYYYYPCEYEEEEDDLEDIYLPTSSSLRIGNRRWGDNGYVSAGRQEARPVNRPNAQGSASGSASREPKKKEAATSAKTGRRAKRALKREAADKAAAATAAAKHEQHLIRLGRK